SSSARFFGLLMLFLSLLLFLFSQVIYTIEMTPSIFTMRPPLYKRINCGLNSITTVVPNQTTGDKYLTATSTCSL
ncbi:hypothetical protein, partial [Leptospira alexanderi]|uniref:hypothetical protein n=1 Tax=Leptospira alexanderi TaxID=100053 RepID=UPI001BAF4CF7